MLDWTISEFLGCMFFFPALIYFALTVYDGIGIFKDSFKTPDRRVWRE